MLSVRKFVLFPSVGPSSSLKRVGDYCFAKTGLEEVSIPDSVRELCDGCFFECASLRRVTFGSSSPLGRIGTCCFAGCRLIDLEIPGSLGSIGGGAFGECSLSGGLIRRDGCRFRVFGGLVLSRHDERCFCSYWVLLSVCIPGRVRELCDCCFKECRSLGRVMFGSSSSLERIGDDCFVKTGLQEVRLPHCVRKLCDCCFGCA